MNFNIFPWRSVKTRLTFFNLAIFLVSLWLLAFYASRMLREDIQRVLGEQQFATVSVMAAQVSDELVGRLKALEDYTTVRITPALLGNATALQTRLEESLLIQHLFNAGLFITDANGTAIASIPVSAERLGVNYMERDHVAAALKEGKTKVSKPVIGKILRVPVVSMAAPIRDVQGKVIGALVGVIDLSKPNFLDKLTESRYGKRGGYFLVALQDRLIVTATDKSRIMQPVVPPGVIRQSDRFIEGFEGYAVYVNSHGEEVLNSSKRIPVTNWSLAATLPTEEAFAPMRVMQQRVLQATLLLTLLVGSLSWWMVRRQLAPLLETAKTLATLSQSTENPQPLPITRRDEIADLVGGFNRLLETLENRREDLLRFRVAMDATEDGIYLTDRTSMRFLDVNAGACKMLGLTREEILTLGPEGVLSTTRAELAPIYDALIASADVPTTEEILRTRRDGSQAWVEFRRKAQRSGDGWIIVTVARDITKRKQAEQKLRDSLAEKEVMMREIHHRVKNNLQMMSALLELQSGYVKDERVLGYFKDSQQRIESMAMIHAQLYNTDNLAQIDFAAYLQGLVNNLCGQFRERCKQVKVQVSAQACILPVDTAIPCGLVITELVSNAMKHAFPGGRAGELRISLRCAGDGKVVLEVADNGVGLPADPKLQSGSRFGLRVVKLMIEEQLHGKLSFESNHGTRVVCEIGVQQ